MNENSNPEVLTTIIILSVLLAILSVTAAFCRTEKSTDYKNKVNISKKNYIIIYPIFFALHMTAILLFNIFDATDVLHIFIFTLQYFTFYIITLIVLAVYNYATHPKVKIEQSKYPNTTKR